MILVLTHSSEYSPHHGTHSHAVPLRDMYKFEQACKNLNVRFQTFLESGICIQSYDPTTEGAKRFTTYLQATEATNVLRDYEIIAIRENGAVITRANQRPSAPRTKRKPRYSDIDRLPEDGRDFGDDIL